MATKRIEIRPGIFIAVSELHKRSNRKFKYAMIERTDISDSEREAILQALGPNKRKRLRVCNKDQIDRAVMLSRTMGRKEAAAATGINFHSLVRHIRLRMMEGKIKSKSRGGHGKTRYTMEQKRACAALAKTIMAEGNGRCYAFEEAGRRLGVNGRSIYHMHTMGMIK